MRLSTALSAIILRLAFAATFAASCFASRETDPWPMQAPSEIPDERVEWASLPNGLRFATMSAPSTNGAISLRLIVNTGVEYVPEGKEGLTRLLERLVFCSASSIDDAGLLRFLLENGMPLEVDRNVDVGLDRTVFALDLPRGESASLETALHFLADALGNLRFTQEDLDRERAALLGESLTAQDPLLRRQRDLANLAFASSPVKELGDDELRRALESIRLEDLERFWNDWYRPGRATLFVVGAIAQEDVKARVERLFSPLAKAGQSPEEPSRKYAPRKGKGDVGVYPTPDRDTRVAAVFVEEKVNLYDKDVEARNLELNLLTLFAEYTVAGEAALTRPFALPVRGVVAHSVAMQGAPSELQRFLLSVFNGLMSLVDRGVQQEERDRFVSRLVSARAFDRYGFGRTPQVEAIADHFVSSLVFRHPFRAPDRQAQLISRALQRLDAPTLERLCRERLSHNAIHCVLAEPRDVKTSEGKIGKALKLLRKGFRSEKGIAETTVASRWSVPARASELGSTRSIEEMTLGGRRVLRYVFDNSLRVNVVPTEEGHGKFQAKLSIGNGITALPDPSPGMDWMGDRSMSILKFGDGPDFPTVFEALQANGLVDVSMGVNNNELFLMAAGDSREDLYDFLALSAQAMVMHHLDEKSFDKLKETMELFAQSKDETNPFSELYGGSLGRDGRIHDSFLPGDVYQIVYETASDWLESALEAGYLELSIVGDVELRVVARQLRETLGALPRREGKIVQPQHGQPAKYPAAGAFWRGSSGSIGKMGTMILYWPVLEQEKGEDYLRLEVLQRAIQLRLALATRGMESKIKGLRVSQLGDPMAPLSSGIRIDLRFAPESLAEVEAFLIKELGSASAWLSSELIEAAESAVAVDAGRFAAVDAEALRRLSQSQGKPFLLESLDARLRGPRAPVDVYREWAKSLLAPANARGGTIVPLAE